MPSNSFKSELNALYTKEGWQFLSTAQFLKNEHTNTETSLLELSKELSSPFLVYFNSTFFTYTCKYYTGKKIHDKT